MGKFIVATIKSWNIQAFNDLKEKYKDHEFVLITDKNELSEETVSKINPDYIFFPHWSWIIPESIYGKYNCVVFHMTDLPFGRGGSPLQNLISRGIYDTKVSAIKVVKEVDAGPIYMKEPLDISQGNADDILKKVSDIVFKKMIPNFLGEKLVPVPQTGEVTSFKRRTPDMSEIPAGLSQRQIYDYIRMLDGEGYPLAFKRYENGKIYYQNAAFVNGKVTAKAIFVEEKE